MGCCAIVGQIRLSKAEEKELRDFVHDPNGRPGASLHYVVLEDYCVSMTIERFEIDGYDADNLQFGFTASYVYDDGELEHLSTPLFQRDLCLELIDEFVSLGGAVAIKDPTREALDVFLADSNVDGKIIINWNMLEGKSFVIPTDPVNNMRLAMLRAMNLDCSLKTLAQLVVLFHCGKIDNLVLPWKGLKQ